MVAQRVRSSTAARNWKKATAAEPRGKGFLMSANPPLLPAARLKLRIQPHPESTLVRCSGRLTADVAAEFKQEVRALIPQTKQIVLDLSEVAFMDSSGLGAIIGVYVTAKKCDCELQLINLSQKIRELLGMTRLLSVFESCGQYGTRMP
jgi:anti-sigma B factor antagonist